MFQISITLAAARRTGLEALDYCRAKGLPDSTHIHGAAQAHRLTIGVDEAFARAWFPPASTHMTAEVDESMLLPGELALTAQTIAFGAVGHARIRELFVAGRFRALAAEAASE